MSTQQHAHRNHLTSPGRLTQLSLALVGALSIFSPTEAVSATISTASTNIYIYTINNSNLIITSTGSVDTSSSGNAVIVTGSPTGTVDNQGTIRGSIGLSGLSLGATITLVNNSGSISGGIGIQNGGSITTLNNSGSIIGNTTAVFNNASSSIGALSNSGLIQGRLNAIYIGNGSSIDMLANSGVIAGNITNDSVSDLIVEGGTGSIFGTLTGYAGSITSSAIGSITNTLSNINFVAGNLLLNDNINVGTYTVTNNATLQVNNHITITGNYNQSASAALLIGVSNSATSTGLTSDTGYGTLYVLGNVTMATGSTITLSKLNSYAFAQGQRYLVIASTGSGTNYNADSGIYSVSGYSGSVTGTVVSDSGYTGLVLVVGAGTTTTGSTGTGSSDSYTPINYATTSNAKSSLAGLFNYNGLNTSLMNLSNAAAALGSTAAGNSAGAQLSPAANTVAASQSASASTSQVVEVVAAHVDGLRVAQAQGSSGVATGEGSNDMAVWGQAFGGKAQQSLRDNVSGYRSTYNGLLLGADKMVHQDWRVGGLLSYANNSVTQSDDNTGSSAHVNSYGLMGYAGYSNERWYLDLTAGAVKHRYSTVRAIDFRDFSGTANGSFNGVQYVTAVQGGMPIKLDSLWQRTTLTPIAKLSYSTLRQNGYTESGGNGAALIVNAVNSNSLKSELGAKIERVFTTSYGEVAPAVQLGWRHEFHDNALQTVSSFAADSSGATSFTTTGSTPLRDTGVLALSTTLTRSDNLTLTARYTLETARGYNAQTADLRLRYQF